MGVALCLPLHIYLNKLFASARDILAYRELTFTSPPGHAASAEDLVDLDKKMKNAIVRNWKIISGFEGEEVAKRYSALLCDFDVPGWPLDLKMSVREKHYASGSVIMAMCDAWKRLVFDYQQQSKFSIFVVVEDDTYNREHVTYKLRPFEAADETCENCNDKVFTKIWMKRLRDPIDGKKAHGCLRNVLSLLEVTTQETERKHLLGQSLKPKKRGRALKAHTLQKLSYGAAVKQAGSRMRSWLMRKVFKTDDARRNWSHSMTAFATRRARRRSGTKTTVNAKPWTIDERKPTRKRKACDLYHSENMHILPAGLTLGQQRKHIMGAWRVAPAADRAAYEQRASGATAADADAPRASYQSLPDRTNGYRARQLTERRKASIRTLDELRCHPCWSAGAQLMSFESVLKEERVITDLPDVVVKKKVDNLFAFDHVLQQNPKGTMTPYIACKIRYGGLCGQEPFAEEAMIGTKNLQIVLRKHFQKKYNEKPCLLHLGIDGCYGEYPCTLR